MNVGRLESRKGFLTNFVRLLGLLLFVYLLVQLEPSKIYNILLRVNIWQVLLAVFLVLFLIALKTFRWLIVLDAQGIRYGFTPAYLAYFASMMVGFLTPGRIGEFSKAIYVAREIGVSSGRAFSGVLADRLFDLFIVIVISVIAMADLFLRVNGLVTLLFIGLICIPVIFFLNDAFYPRIQRFVTYVGGIAGRVFQSNGWFDRQTTWRLSNRFPSGCRWHGHSL